MKPPKQKTVKAWDMRGFAVVCVYPKNARPTIMYGWEGGWLVFRHDQREQADAARVAMETSGSKGWYKVIPVLITPIPKKRNL